MPLTAPGSTRIKGGKISFTLGSGATATDFWMDATSVVLDNEDADSDVTTFYDAEQGGAKNYFFTISLIQSLDATSFWRYIWANTGQVLPYTYAPKGNEAPTADEPHFIGTVKIPAKPTLGGDAGATATSEIRFDCQEVPTLDDGTAD